MVCKKQNDTFRACNTNNPTDGVLPGHNMQHTMSDETVQDAPQDAPLSGGAQKECARLRFVPDPELFEVKYKQNIVSAMSIYSDDDDVNGVHLFEDTFIRTMIATPKEQPHAFKSYDTYTSVFDKNQIAVHIGKPIMVPFDTFKGYSRTNGGNVMLFLNTIISVKSIRIRKRAREE